MLQTNGFKALFGSTQFDSEESSISRLNTDSVVVSDVIDVTDATVEGLGTDDVAEEKNLYYTETRVTNNASVAANTSHRNQQVGIPMVL